jgi:hypothetical protein
MLLVLPFWVYGIGIALICLGLIIEPSHVPADDPRDSDPNFWIYKWGKRYARKERERREKKERLARK